MLRIIVLILIATITACGDIVVQQPEPASQEELEQPEPSEPDAEQPTPGADEPQRPRDQPEPIEPDEVAPEDPEIPVSAYELAVLQVECQDQYGARHGTGTKVTDDAILLPATLVEGASWCLFISHDVVVAQGATHQSSSAGRDIAVVHQLRKLDGWRYLPIAPIRFDVDVRVGQAVESIGYSEARGQTLTTSGFVTSADVSLDVDGSRWASFATDLPVLHLDGAPAFIDGKVVGIVFGVYRDTALTTVIPLIAEDAL